MNDSDPSRYGFSFVKSGYEDVADDLISDFASNGLELIHDRRIILGARAIDYMYRDSLQDFFYPAMREHLMANPIMALSLYGENLNTQQVLLDLKNGSNGRENLRKKYTRGQLQLPDAEVDLWYKKAHPRQDEVTVQLTQHNVFHTADSTAEALLTLRLLIEQDPEFFNSSQGASSHLSKLVRLLTNIGPRDILNSL